MSQMDCHVTLNLMLKIYIRFFDRQCT